jgi:nucleosome binding factor SPN SPT16 subunit
VAVAVGGSSEDLRYLKSISLHLWLFGYELPGECAARAALPQRCCNTVVPRVQHAARCHADTIMVFTKEKMHVLTSQKKGGRRAPSACRAPIARAAERPIAP